MFGLTNPQNKQTYMYTAWKQRQLTYLLYVRLSICVHMLGKKVLFYLKDWKSGVRPNQRFEVFTKIVTEYIPLKMTYHEPYRVSKRKWNMCFRNCNFCHSWYIRLKIYLKYIQTFANKSYLMITSQKSKTKIFHA